VLVIGMICSLFVSLSFVLNPNKRQFPANLVAGFSISFLLLDFFVFIPILSGFEDFMCRDDFTSVSSNDGRCVFQGSVILYFIYVSILYWTATCLFVTIVMLSGAVDKKWRWITHALILSVPIVPVIGSAASEEIG